MTPIPSTPIEMKDHRADRAYVIEKQIRPIMVDLDRVYMRRQELLDEYNAAVQRQLFLGTPLPDRLRGLGGPSNALLGSITRGRR